MPIRAAEPGSKEALCAVPCNRDAHSPSSEAEDIQVIVLDPLACRKFIVTKRRACAGHFVGSYGGANTAPAHENASLHLSAGDSTSEGKRKIRIVVVAVIGPIAEINDFVAFLREQRCKLLLHFESAMICADANFHTGLSFSTWCFAIWLLAAATIFSVLKPNFFNSCFRGADAPN